METSVKYVLGNKNVGLGNFINLSPAIRALSEHWGEKINVYFEMPIVKQCFLDCPFINILEERPEGKPIMQSIFYKVQFMNSGKYVIPDYQFLFEYYKKEFGYKSNDMSTYCDNPKFDVTIKDHVCFVNGAGAWSKDYLDTKVIDPKIYKDISNFLGDETKLVLGSQHCNNPLKYAIDCRTHSIRRQLSHVANCKMLITNEGGLCHAAGAMKIPTFCMWKNTHKIKNKNPNPNCFYSYNNHVDNFKKFYEQYS